MNFDFHKEKQFAVVTMDGSRLDASQATVFKDYMLDLIKNGEQNIILDLSNIHFMDSSGLGAIMAVKKEMSDDKNSICLANPQAAVSDLLSLTCMNEVFPIFTSVNDALKGAE